MTLAQFDALSKRYSGEQEGLNYRTALLCSVIAEPNRDRKKKSKPFTPDDFMPKRKKKEEKLSGEQLADRIKAMNTILGGEVK